MLFVQEAFQHFGAGRVTQLTQRFGDQAAFVSAGGYHHHMAMNIWRSRGAGIRQQTLGLGDVAIDLPDEQTFGSLVEKLKHYGADLRDEGNQIKLDDPWGNQVTLKLNPS